MLKCGKGYLTTKGTYHELHYKIEHRNYNWQSDGVSPNQVTNILWHSPIRIHISELRNKSNLSCVLDHIRNWYGMASLIKALSLTRV